MSRNSAVGRLQGTFESATDKNVLSTRKNSLMGIEMFSMMA